MKLDLQAKFLQHLNKKKQDEGFTLIELLVVIIIIGILAAIALPSFLNQANKAKQSEAKTYVGSMNRGQQAFYLENDYFTSKEGFGDLGLGIATETSNYKYDINGGATEAGVAGGTAATNQAQPKGDSLKAYLGGVNIGQVAATSEATTLAVLCEAKIAKALAGGGQGTEVVDYNQTGPTCPAGAPEYKNLGGKL